MFQIMFLDEVQWMIFQEGHKILHHSCLRGHKEGNSWLRFTWSDFTVPSPIPSTHFCGGHVARLDDVTPANMALQLHINVSLNRPPDRTWRRPPGRLWNKWLDQLRNDSIRPTGELWRRAVDRGHGGATTRRPSAAMRRR